MYMITAMMLNPCIDRTLTIDVLKPGGLNRILSSADQPGGKGFNVANALSRLGLPSAISGLMFKENSATILNALKTHGIKAHFLSIDGHVRVNLKVFDRTASAITEFNESGHPVDAQTLERLCQKVRHLASRSKFMVFSGSVCPGLADDTYRILIDIAKSAACTTALDADGALFRNSIAAKPHLIKPNLFELEQYAGQRLDSLAAVKQAALDITAHGVAIVLVSMGADGAMIADGTHTYYAPGLKADVKGTVGAGDCMLAGAILGLSENKPPSDILRLATAAATASVEQPGTGFSKHASISAYLDKIDVREI